MPNVSNILLTLLQKEFDRLIKVCAAEEVKLPTKRDLEKKIAQMNRLIAQPVTEVCVLILWFLCLTAFIY